MKRDYKKLRMSDVGKYNAIQRLGYNAYDKQLLTIARWGFEQCEQNANLTETQLIENFRNDFQSGELKDDQNSE